MLKKFLLYSLVLFSLFSTSSVFACDSCGNALARGTIKEASDQKPWFFDFTFEQLNWDEKKPSEAHTLHHQGRHFHDKTHEEIYHFTLGANPVEDLTFVAELPYVVRGSLDIEHHPTLGNKQSSEGVGDLNLLGIYRFWKNNENFLGLVGGVKLPTGSTNEKDPVGDRFESELQPGTGSYDGTIGTAFQCALAPFVLRGNALFAMKGKSEGHDFEAGDLFSTYLFLDYLLNPDSRSFQSRVGLDATLQVEGKQKEDGARITDSGGTTILLGPAFHVKTTGNSSVFANILFPVYQDLGGVHQELDFVWNAGCKITW